MTASAIISSMCDPFTSGPSKGWAASKLFQAISAILVIAWGTYVYVHFHTDFGLFLVLLVPVAALINRGIVKRDGSTWTNAATRSDERTGESLIPVTNTVQPSSTLVRWVGAADVLGGMGRINASTPLAVLELQGNTLTLKGSGVVPQQDVRNSEA